MKDKGVRMHTKPTDNSDAILRRILENSPEASLHEIRRDHPVFRQMSYDHLMLRVSQVVRRAGTGAK